jgi:hypothetical protein
MQEISARIAENDRDFVVAALVANAAGLPIFASQQT